MRRKYYRDYQDLPVWATSQICRFRPADAETWVFKPVPALGGQSFIEVLNQGEEGEIRARRYLNNLAGKFLE